MIADAQDRQPLGLPGPNCRFGIVPAVVCASTESDSAPAVIRPAEAPAIRVKNSPRFTATRPHVQKVDAL
jgi:hypothetical protein